MGSKNEHSDVSQSVDRRHFEVPLELKDRALANAGEGITISDFTRLDNPLIYVNRGFEQLTGYSAEEVLGRNCRFLQGARTDPQAAERIREAIREQREVTVEILNYRKDGREFWNRLAITPVRDDAGRVTNFIGIQSDITQRRQAEDGLLAANEKMKRDVEAASRIQQTMLPHSLFDIEGIETAWAFEACEDLGGDMLNIFMLDEAHLAFYVADVTGHGVSAALLAVSLSHVLSPVGEESVLYDSENGKRGIASPARVAERLNREFRFDENTQKFFTLVFGIFDLQTHRLRFVNAGHPSPIHVKANGEVESIEGSGFPIGVMDEGEYVDRTLQVDKGEKLLLYTDGVVEAADANGDEFGERRLIETAAELSDRTTSDLVDEILGKVRRWRAGEASSDDVSMVCVGRK